MKFRSLMYVFCTSLATLLFATFAQAQAPAAEASPSQSAQADAASKGKYGFFIFYREDNDATRAMAQVVSELATQRPNEVAPIFVQVTNPAEGPTVRQFNLERAPLPLVLVAAPNGAVTGAYPQRVTADQLTASFVTPAMSHCMKSMQQGRLVFLCVQTTPQASVPQGVAEFLSDPQFQARTDVVAVQAADPAEVQLLKELAVNPTDPNGTNTVFFAPPGVLVGKFTASTNKAELATALHNAGKCCDDPNCKHGHAHQPKTGAVR